MQPVQRTTGAALTGPAIALGLVLLAGLAPGSAVADETRHPAMDGMTLAAHDIGLPGSTLDDHALEHIRARNAAGNTPSPSDRRTGVILWDEGGSTPQSGQRRSHSSGSGNRQSHTLELEY